MPYELTHSCYQGLSPACGVCDTCQARLGAFAAAAQSTPSRTGAVKTTITVSATFAAAHRLPDHEGKCFRLHGHTYGLEVTVDRDPADLRPGRGHGDGFRRSEGPSERVGRGSS